MRQRRRHDRADGNAFAQLIRFALVGGASNVAYVLLFLAMNGIGPLVANSAGSIVSTVIANELHRQLTFRAAGRVGWFTAQWEGGGLALIGLLISTVALAGLGCWAPGLGEITQTGAVLAITAAVGGLRFLALRGLVFGNLDDSTSPHGPGHLISHAGLGVGRVAHCRKRDRRQRSFRATRFQSMEVAAEEQ